MRFSRRELRISTRADLMAHNQTLPRQIQILSQKCDGQAELCRKSEEDAECAAKEAKRQLKLQAEEHTRQGGAL
jgi:hypothetical protein